MRASQEVVSDNAVQKEEISSVLQEFASLDDQIGRTADKAEEIKGLVDQMVCLNQNITDNSNGLTDVSSSNAAATRRKEQANIENSGLRNGVAEMAGQ